MKKHLGKGLEALISELVSNKDIPQSGENAQLSTSVSYGEGGVILVEITKLKPSKWQPRKSFDEQKLQELASSIKHSGIIEPLIVSPLDTDVYEIVCGERRWRAAQIAGLSHLPVIVRQLNEQQKRLLSLVENLQREELNPVEEAEAYQSLIKEYNLTQEQIAEFVSKDRSVIANTIRILSLPAQVLNYVREGLITAGHARTLASIKDENLVVEIAEKIIQDKLTVRDVENIVKKIKATKKIKTEKHSNILSPEIRHLQKELSELLGVKV
ncbi:MAG: ParB/RepB/Spo0J family partition protein, partial [Endomicrobia bacterium]|nr:ParB/RepB/Spo0J family partition protein [Endomicrobiia bacterium]